MPILNDPKRAAVAVIGGVSAVCASVVAINWFQNKKKSKTDSNSCPPDSNSHSDNRPIDFCDSTDPNMQPVVNRGGRKNYRAIKKRQLNSSSSIDSMSRDSQDQEQLQQSIDTHQMLSAQNSGPTPSSSNSSTNFYQAQQQQQTDHEARATQLAAEFSKNINLNCSSIITTTNQNTTNSGQPTGNDVILPDTNQQTILDDNNSTNNNDNDGYLTSLTAMKEHSSSVESPSLAIDGRSEGSQDSGKGASVGVTSSVSPVEELVETPYVYEFEIPQNIVGLIIGRQGVTIKQITEKSGAQMIIRKHYNGDNYKICTIEGRRDQINNCLRLIRRKFPPSRFPELKLTPLLPPPIISSITPVLDSIVRLSLPEGIKCEAVVSSLIEPDHFFVQQPTHPSFTSLARLDQYMLAVYGQVMGVPGLPRPIEEGVICAAPVMDGWFRAQTIEMYDDTDEVLVKFVDYGGYLKINSSDLRQIRSDFMTLPFQAIECTLHNIKPIDENEGWSPESMAFFEQCIYGKIVEATVKGVNPNCTMAIELYYNTYDSNGQQQSVTINQTLVENGFAKWIDDVIEPNID